MSAAAFLGRFVIGRQPGRSAAHMAAHTKAQSPFDRFVKPARAKPARVKPARAKPVRVKQPEGRPPRDRQPGDRQAARDIRTRPAPDPLSTGLSRDFRCAIL